MNTRKENGFVAWNNPAKYFEPRLALQQGAALQELTRMILTRAKNPEETRKKLIIYQSKVKDGAKRVSNKVKACMKVPAQNLHALVAAGR